jgi:hypothetical protein
LLNKFCWAALKSFKNSAAYEKNFRLRDKNNAPFKLNGQPCTAFGLLKAPELQRLSVTAEVLRVGVISVGVMTVGVLSVGVMPYYPTLTWSLQDSTPPFSTCHILDFGVRSHNVIDQSMIINFEMKKIFGGESKQNPRDTT